MACTFPLPQNISFKRALFILQDGRCPYCGCEMVFTNKHIANIPRKQRWRVATQEHLTPKVKRGSNAYENRMLACYGCNMRRGHGPVQIGMYVVGRRQK